MMLAQPLRLGVLRPTRPTHVVAVAEARVIRSELERRLGPLTLDLRIAGVSIGGWQSVANASWPGSVDVVVDASMLWNSALPPLTTLFARTVEPTAAEVRHRMLAHLGAIPDATFELDDERLATLSELPLRPTDLWLIACAAAGVNVDDPNIRAFGTTVDSDGHHLLDTAFDAVAASLSEQPTTGTTLERLTASTATLTRRVAELDSELMRGERDAAELLDQLRAENGVLRERLERAELQHSLNA